MQMIKKPLSILLSLILVFSVFTVVPVVTAGAAEAEVSYVDESGSDQTVTATILTGEEAVQSDGSVVLGTDSNTTTTWYAVLDDVTYGDGNSTVNIEILGKVCIIVADGSTLTVNGSIKKSPDASSISLSDVYLYGQSDQTGAVSADSIDLMDNIVVCGGSLTVDEIDQNITNLSDGVIIDTYQGSLTADTINAQRIRVYGGELNADIITTCFTYNDGGELNTRILDSRNPAEQPEFSEISIQIQRGITNISDLVRTNGMELGCGDIDSRITIYDFEFDASTNTKKVAMGQTLTDGDREYSGALSADDLSAMAHKTLMKAHEHSASTMTHHTASEPSYDPLNGVYTNGCVEYYTCPICGLNYIEENGSFVRKTTEEVTIPYFSFRTVVVDGNTLCEVVGYNGQDADIVIPDTVPDNYPDSDQVGNTIIGIDHNVFKNNTVITSVTTGDDLRGINEGAFEGCTALTAVTTGSSFNHIGAGAFKGCTALTSFTSLSSESIYYVYNDEHNENSFDTNCGITFNGPHGSSLCDIANDYSCSFIPSDDHTVTWAWSADYSSATATFICVGCQQSGKEYEADVTKDGVNASATVTVEGKTYTERIDFAVALIEPDRYYASVADALPYAYANDAVIILLKNASFQYTNELCELYPTYRLKANGFTYDYGDPLPCYGLSKTAPDENGVSTYAVEAGHDVDFDNIYCILEEDAGKYTAAVHMICPRCDFDTVLRNEVEKHAAAAPTCTESGNVEYYSIYDYNGGYPFTNYYVLKDPAEADYENELELLGSDVADVTIPATGHNMTAHPAVAPMLIVGGNSAYWSCDRCGKYFSDENGEHEIPENSWILPGTATLVPTSYIDENGEEQTVSAIVLTGDEAEDYHTTSSGFYFYTALGDASDLPIWYVVNQDTSLYHDENFKRNIELTGDVRIIVADGVTFTVQGEIKGGSLSVYGQTNQTGKLIANNINYCNSLSVCSGGLTVNTTVSCKNLAIYSGTTEITGAIDVNDGTAVLGCKRDSDSITLGSLTINYGASASIAAGQTLTDGVNNYSGDLSDSDLSAMAGKTLIKAHEHIAADMEYHDAIPARYNADTGSYINGCKEYYYCPICRGYFVKDGESLVSTTASELLLPYFVFWKMPSVSGTCYLRQYNGADADVNIPDTVPECFATSGTPAGTPITHIENNVFASHTELETVTTGTGLCRIGAGAFAGCTALTDFTSTAAQKVYYEHDEQNATQDSFDDVTDLRIHATHASELFSTVQNYGFTFEVTDRHIEPTWIWSEDYRSATAEFDCDPYCPFDATQTAEVAITTENDLTVYTATVTADGYTYTARKDSTTAFIHYVDASGSDAAAEAKILTSTETALDAGWYAVTADTAFSGGLTLTGDVKLILCDGATLSGLTTVSTAQGETATLKIYAQSGGTGAIEAEEITVDSALLAGGSVSVSGDLTATQLTVIRGSVNIGGSLSATTVEFGCENAADSISLGTVSVDFDNGGSLKITENQTLVDGLHSYTGTLTADDASHMTGRTLVPVHEHNNGNLTHHAAVAPTYDSATGTYANGTAAHDTCNVCGGCLLSDNGIYTYVDPADLLVPYFTIQAFQILGVDTVIYSEIAGYNGTDNDVVIPDTVPDNYPDSTQRGRTINSIGSEAFKNNSFIENVTMGDYINIISADAFRNCAALSAVTVGENLQRIESGAFLGCSSLESFTSTSTSQITYYKDYQSYPDSFDTNSGITFYGPHGSWLLDAANDYGFSFVPLDLHADPAWTWAADYSSATATFACSRCQLTAPNNTATDDSPDADCGATDVTYTASVTVDGFTYTDTVTVSYWTQLQNQINAAGDNTATTISLAHDCVASAEETALVVPAGKIITIDLNGHDIDRDMETAAADGNVITNNGTLTITGNGTITGGSNTANGGAILNNSTLTISTGVTISYNSTTEDGGAIYNSGTLTINGGTINNNISAKSGGAISAHRGAITINGGEIKNNRAGSHGGAIYLGNKDGNIATLNLCGGTITGNTVTGSDSQGGGICDVGTLNVSGNPVVKNNTAPAYDKGYNIYLRGGKKVNVTGELTDGAEIGVTAPGGGIGVVTSGLSGNGTADSFFSDNPDYYVDVNGSGEGTLAQYYVFSFDSNGGTGEQETIRSKTNEIELPDCTFTAPEGRCFMAWNVGGIEKQPGETATIESGYAMTVTAVWADAYHIEIEDGIEHGTVTPDAEYAVEGQTITLTVTPDEGYVLQELYVTPDGDNPIVLDPETPTLSFTMPAQDVSIHAYFAKGTAYVDAKGNDMPAKIALELVSSDIGWGGSVHAGETTSWYCAEGEVTINERITVTGDVNLILCDGATLTIPKGINVAKDTSLTIWQQKGGTGHLVINSVESGKAGIGSDSINTGTAGNKTAGTITINGGILDVCGGLYAAAIGGGESCSGGTITINGGVLSARGGYYAAAIGGGRFGKAGSVTISGGAVNATANWYGAAIGRGHNATYTQDDTVTINGGTVNAVMTSEPYATSDYSVMNGSTFTLNYTDESKYTMSVMAESWSGTVKLSKTFVDEDGASYAAQTVSDNSILDGKTLRPAFDRFAKHSLTLNGDIGVNFYLDLSEVEISQGAVVNFKLNGEALSSYTVKSTDKYTIDGKTYYKATCRVCAPEMADTIRATLTIGGEEVAAEEYSVKTYGDTFLSDEYKTTFLEKGHTLDEYNKLAALVQTMLNYGAYTQIQFSEENAGSNPNNNTTHDAANLANADINYDLTPLTKNEINAIEMSAPNKEAMNAKLSGTGLTYYGYTMLLHSETKLRFYFIKDSKNTDITGIHLSRDGVTYDAQNYNAKYAFVEVPAIPAYELNYSYTLTVGEENLGSYSALTYVKDVLENSPDDTTLRNTVTAMYRYHMAAVEWFNNN